LKKIKQGDKTAGEDDVQELKTRRKKDPVTG
jgi:hypothetical protein